MKGKRGKVLAIFSCSVSTVTCTGYDDLENIIYKRAILLESIKIVRVERTKKIMIFHTDKPLCGS